MIPGGSLGTHIVEHSKLGVATGGAGWSFDGTDWILTQGGNILAKIQTATGDLLITGDIKTNQSL